MKKEIISIIGNLVLDRIIIRDKCMDSCPGGTAFYAGIALAKLNAGVQLISKIGADYPDHFLTILMDEGINIDSVTKSKTKNSTSFLLNYSDNLENREARVTCRGPVITPEDIPKRINQSRVVLLGMVASEIDPEVISLLDHDNIHLIGADLHFIREISDDGKITLGQGANFRPFMHKIDVIKGSFVELKAFAGTENIEQALKKISSMGPKIILATDGANGSILYSKGAFFKIPAYRVIVEETTGAGDIFLSSFLYFCGLKQDDPVKSAYLASAAASFVVEGNGISSLGNEEEIRKRAEILNYKNTSSIP